MTLLSLAAGDLTVTTHPALFGFSNTSELLQQSLPWIGQAHQWRHNDPDQCLRESIMDGDRLISLDGEKTSQLNGLTQIDLGDYRFGIRVRVTARTSAGDEGLLNIVREVALSGPIDDKGELILQRNRRHLMLDGSVAHAVADGSFHIHTVAQLSEALPS